MTTNLGGTRIKIEDRWYFVHTYKDPDDPSLWLTRIWQLPDVDTSGEKIWTAFARFDPFADVPILKFYRAEFDGSLKQARARIADWLHPKEAKEEDVSGYDYDDPTGG